MLVYDLLSSKKRKSVANLSTQYKILSFYKVILYFCKKNEMASRWETKLFQTYFYINFFVSFLPV